MAALLVLPPLALACAAATEPAAAASRATLMLCATTLLMATCGAVPLLLLEGGGSWAELQPGGGITLSWWVSRAATLSLAAGATAAPPLLHALVRRTHTRPTDRKRRRDARPRLPALVRSRRCPSSSAHAPSRACTACSSRATSQASLCPAC